MSFEDNIDLFFIWFCLLFHFLQRDPVSVQQQYYRSGLSNVTLCSHHRHETLSDNILNLDFLDRSTPETGQNANKITQSKQLKRDVDFNTNGTVEFTRPVCTRISLFAWRFIPLLYLTQVSFFFESLDIHMHWRDKSLYKEKIKEYICT